MFNFFSHSNEAQNSRKPQPFLDIDLCFRAIHLYFRDKYVNSSLSHAGFYECTKDFFNVLSLMLNNQDISDLPVFKGSAQYSILREELKINLSSVWKKTPDFSFFGINS